MKYKKLLPFLISNVIIFTGSVIAIILKVNFLTYLLISFLPASIYLLFLIHKARLKIVAISVIWGIIAAQVLDSVAHISKSYTVESIFSFRIIATPVECYIWGILFCILVLAGYEYFFDTKSTKKLSKNHKYMIMLLTSGFIFFLIAYIATPLSLNISYFYLLYTVFVALIDFVIFFKARKLFTVAGIFSLTILPLYLIHEMTSLKLGYWVFHFENLTGGINIVGFLIPIEEILFFIISPILLIACYELFADNQKV